MDIAVSVVGQKLQVLPENLRRFAPGSKNFVRFVFSLSADWNGMTTFAQFSQDGVGYNIYLDANNAACMPHEIAPGICRLMLYGTSGATKIGTTNCLTLTINDNGFVSNASSTDLTPSLYEQLILMISNITTNYATKSYAADTYATKSYVEDTYATKSQIGSPLTAATASAMTSTGKIYVYTGSESGYTFGHWYYHDGSAWVDGGPYNSVALETDTTLSESGKAADAAVSGSMILGTAGALEQTGYTTTNRMSVEKGSVAAATGSSGTASRCARTGYTGIDSSIVIVGTNLDFQYNIWGYRLQSQSSSSKVRSLTNQQYVPPGTPVIVPYGEGIRYFRIGFRRISSDEAVSDEEVEAILGGIRLYGISPVRGENYNPVQFLDSAATGSVSSMTVIRDKLFVFPYIESSDGTTTDDIKGKVYDIGIDGTLAYSRAFESNIGHTNTVDYSHHNYCMLATRYREAAELNEGAAPVYNLYIFQAVNDVTSNFDVNDTSVNENGRPAVITIDMTGYLPASYGTCENINAVWGPTNFGRYDLVCILARFDLNGVKKRYISIVQLGKGNKNLNNGSSGTGGTFISGCPDEYFNGTYKVQNTLEREYRDHENTNDACFHNGKLYEMATKAPNGKSPNGVVLMIHSFQNYMSEISTERVFIPRYNASGGSGTTYEAEGIAIYKGRMYTGARSDGIRVFEYWD